MTAISPMTKPEVFPKPVCLLSVKIVSDPKRETFGLSPMTIILMEYKPVIVKIPAKMGWTFNFVCKIAVTIPAKIPAPTAPTKAKTGCPVAVIITAAAAPSVKLPSTVKSGMSNMR